MSLSPCINIFIVMTINTKAILDRIQKRIRAEKRQDHAGINFFDGDDDLRTKKWFEGYDFSTPTPEQLARLPARPLEYA